MKVFKKKDDLFAGSIMGLSGEYADAIFRLEIDEVITFGRDPKTSQIVLGDDSGQVSRTHCRVRYDRQNRCYVVCDVSSNGTFVDDERLEKNVEYQVEKGSVVALGDSSNTFRLN